MSSKQDFGNYSKRIEVGTRVLVFSSFLPESIFISLLSMFGIYSVYPILESKIRYSCVR
jgi:hypothetical protein